MDQNVWGYKFKEKLQLRLHEQKKGLVGLVCHIDEL
jgi:hypothetical protein